MRRALASARSEIEEALGPGTKVGPITRGGFEVFTDDPSAEEQISEAVSKSALRERPTGSLVLTERGMIVQDQEAVDGSMIGL